MKIAGMTMTVLHPNMGDRGLSGWRRSYHSIKAATEEEISAAYLAASKVLRNGSHIVAVEVHWDYAEGTEPIVPEGSWTRLYSAADVPVEYIDNEGGGQ